MAEQWIEPARSRHAVGVDEGDQRAADRGQPRVAGDRRARIDGQPDEPGPVVLGDLPDGDGVGGRVVHHDARQVTERAEQPLELDGSVAHRHDDRHVIGGEGGWSRLRHERASRHQAARQELGRPGGADRHAGAPARHEAPGPFRYPEEA